jgi:hypothetical protein
MFQVGSGLGPGCRIDRRRSLYCSDKRRREVRAYIAETAAAAGCVRLPQFVETPGRHRQFPRHELEEQNPQAVEVADRCGRGAIEHLRRHIERRACG